MSQLEEHEPRVKNCETRPIDHCGPLSPPISECLLKDPQCQYALSLYDSFFCFHPDHHAFQVRR
jgi:hypothetical protein